MVALCKRISENASFQKFITWVIVAAAVLVGIETSHDMVKQYGTLLHLADKVIIAVFTFEVAVKLVGLGGKWPSYFRDAWNVFDFLIVIACFMPVGATYVTVLRLLRLLRVLRVLRAFPKLQLIVGALIKSLPSMVYVSLLMFLVFYIYGVAAVFLFGPNDPVHFGTLPLSMLSLFSVVTLEGWADLMYVQMYGCAQFGYEGKEALCTASTGQPLVGAFFFITFVLLGTMIMLNLFIGVIMNSMQETQKETEEALIKEKAKQQGDRAPHLGDELEALSTTLGKMQEDIARMKTKVEAHLYPVAASPPAESAAANRNG